MYEHLYIIRLKKLQFFDTVSFLLAYYFFSFNNGSYGVLLQACARTAWLPVYMSDLFCGL